MICIYLSLFSQERNSMKACITTPSPSLAQETRSNTQFSFFFFSFFFFFFFFSSHIDANIHLTATWTLEISFCCVSHRNNPPCCALEINFETFETYNCCLFFCLFFLFCFVLFCLFFPQEKKGKKKDGRKKMEEWGRMKKEERRKKKEERRRRESRKQLQWLPTHARTRETTPCSIIWIYPPPPSFLFFSFLSYCYYYYIIPYLSLVLL